MGANLRLKVWGARGTIPSPGESRSRYGGNTSCLTVSLSDHEHLILDCGSGMRLFGASLPKKGGDTAHRFHVFLSHYHFDHVEGLALFLPLYDPRARFTIYGMDSCGLNVQAVLESLVRPPYFPVTLAEVPATIEYADTADLPTTIGDVKIDTLPLNHPDGCLSFRLTRGDRRIVYATDHEHGHEAIDRALIEFSRGANCLVYDATYQPAEYEELRKGWGHSTWYAAVHSARTAGVEQLILFHHHPDHTDDELDRVLEVARGEFPDTLIAHEGLELPL